MTVPESTYDAAVRVGQVWADNDERSAGRTVRVVAVDETHATVEVVTNDTITQQHVDRYGKKSALSDRRGKRSRVLLRRFKPTSTGYRLASEPATTTETTGRP